jgi:AGCS family alanine or glycine:cation symporter
LNFAIKNQIKMKGLKTVITLYLLASLWSDAACQDTLKPATDSTTMVTSALPVAEVGLDSKIDTIFRPFANLTENLVLYPIHVGGNGKIIEETERPKWYPHKTESGVDVPLIVILLSLGGLFFSLYFRFPSIFKFGLATKVVQGHFDDIETKGTVETHPEETVFTVDGDIVQTIREEHHHGEVSHFQALATAVSGTVGLGNIAGVTIAISVGGPGATFWMIVSGMLGMTLKFVECTLGVQYRDINKNGVVFGGPMYYLSKGLKEKGYTSLGKVLAVLFAILCIGGSFGGGNAAQANQAAAQIVSLFGMTGGSSGFIVGVCIAILVGITIIGGIKRIATVTEKLVPLMAIIYIIACLVVIFTNISDLGAAFNQIFTQAFNPQAGLGGILGVLVIGFRRAAFSNEAGAGSASIAHSAVRTKYSASEGLVALLEPFIDTVVICTLTAVVIVIFNADGVFQYGAQKVMINGQQYEGATLTSLAFAEHISFFPIILTIAIFLFAVSTMISWSYYGLQAWLYLFGKGKVTEIIYKVIFLLFIVIGASANMSAVWGFSDAMILAMVFPNMVGLLILFPVVKRELTRYEKAISSSK